ncbi:MAG: hypothetical protein M5R36_02515 [Deltaproteobacteria bacterium]|nr:hypothetical protein [Deltaproteobacteria bacterium]
MASGAPVSSAKARPYHATRLFLKNPRLTSRSSIGTTTAAKIQGDENSQT